MGFWTWKLLISTPCHAASSLPLCLLPASPLSTHGWLVSVARSCLTHCDLVDCSPPGSSVLGILQARIQEYFLQGILPPGGQTRLSLLNCSWIPYHLNQQGSPTKGWGDSTKYRSEPITFPLQTHWEPLPHSEQIPKSSPGSVSVSGVTSSLLPPWLTPSQLLCWDAVSGTHQAGCSLTSFTHSFCLGVLPGCLGLASWLLTDATSSGGPPWLMCPSQHSSPSVPSLCFICLHNIYTLSHHFIYL